MAYITIFISFILEGIFTNIVSMNSIFIPLFTITSLVMLFPYFNDKRDNLNYIVISAIAGLFYDIVYTNSLFVNTFAFTLCSLLVIFINKYVTSNLFNRSCINIVIIIIYRIFTFFALCLFQYIHFNENILLKGIYSSIIANIIFGIIIYIVFNKIGKKLNLKKNE